MNSSAPAWQICILQLNNDLGLSFDANLQFTLPNGRWKISIAEEGAGFILFIKLNNYFDFRSKSHLTHKFIREQNLLIPKTKAANVAMRMFIHFRTPNTDKYTTIYYTTIYILEWSVFCDVPSTEPKIIPRRRRPVVAPNGGGGRLACYVRL